MAGARHLSLIAALVLAYAVGSIPTAYLLVKCLRGVDVRSVGSGNVGATNALRAAGKGAGLAVLAIDFLKGVVAASLIPLWLLDPTPPGARLWCGLAAILGHCFPWMLRFQGGKGVATTLGVLLGADPAVAGLVAVIWVAVFAVWRYVSLGSLAAAIAVPVAQLALHRSLTEMLLGAAMAILVVARHRSNLDRLLNGVEHRFGAPVEASAAAKEKDR